MVNSLAGFTLGLGITNVLAECELVPATASVLMTAKDKGRSRRFMVASLWSRFNTM
ncbi:hypothetical protein VAE115_370512 [Vibrio aestuarianus]|nr:hypothetical protein VAE115_370512 [Vibrio aestuarianus]